MEIQWPAVAGWSLVAAEALALLAWLLLKRDKRKEELRAEYRNRLRDEKLAEAAYEEAVRSGTASEAHRAAAALDAIRKTLDVIRQQMALVAVALFTLAAAGCITREGPERIVQLDEHIRIVQPGETVPDFATGESRWWLVSPTGLMELMPKYRQEEF